MKNEPAFPTGPQGAETMNEKEIQALRKLMKKMLLSLPRKMIWQTLRIRVWDLYQELGSLDNKTLARNLRRKP